MNTPNPVIELVPNARQPPAAPAVGVFGQAVGTKALIRSARTKRRTGWTSNDENALTALSARSSGLDDINGGPECGVYTQMSGVEQVRVGRRFQGGGGAPGIPFVAAEKVG